VGHSNGVAVNVNDRIQNWIGFKRKIEFD